MRESDSRKTEREKEIAGFKVAQSHVSWQARMAG